MVHIAVRGRKRFSYLLAVAAALHVLSAPRADAREQLCDPSYQNCRTPLLDIINAETVEIDVGLWFMEDARYSSAIVQRWKAGVKVLILMDPRVFPQDAPDVTVMNQLQAGGIPMRKRIASGIEHWKAMIFAGQRTVYFGSANFSDEAFVPASPYVNYVDETVYFTDDATVVNSFMRKFDDAWTDTTNYANYANSSGTPARSYPTYAIDPELNFPPDQDYAARSVKDYNRETRQIDVMMFRITDRRHTDAMIAAHARGVAIRLMVDHDEYRLPARLWDAWNVDRLYAAGIPIRWNVHQGVSHGKLVLLYGLGETIFGSSNWSSPSAASQHEHNYFTNKTNIFNWFVTYFERRWNNSNPLGVQESAAFAPLPPDKPVYKSPASGATSIGTSSQKLAWDGGPWAHNYDIYFGTSSPPPLLAANQNLGPDDPASPSQQKYTLATLQPGTTYYWQIVSKTMANQTKTGSDLGLHDSGDATAPRRLGSVAMGERRRRVGALRGRRHVFERHVQDHRLRPGHLGHRRRVPLRLPADDRRRHDHRAGGEHPERERLGEGRRHDPRDALGRIEAGDHARVDREGRGIPAPAFHRRRFGEYDRLGGRAPALGGGAAPRQYDHRL